MMRKSRSMAMGPQGTVLLSMLWFVVILSAIAFSLAASVRVEASFARVRLDSHRAFLMAKSAAEVTFLQLSRSPNLFAGSPVVEDEGVFVFPFEAGEARVRLEFDRSQIGISSAPEALLVSMIDSLEVGLASRNQIVDSILDWQDADDMPRPQGAERVQYQQPLNMRLPRNSGFQSVEELLLVQGVTAEVFNGRLVRDPVSGAYRRVPGLRELVKVGGATASVDPNQAAYVVLRAIPGIDDALARTIIVEREAESFQSMGDLLDRVPALRERTALGYLDMVTDAPVVIVSEAIVFDTDTRSMVRLLTERTADGGRIQKKRWDY